MNEKQVNTIALALKHLAENGCDVRHHWADDNALPVNLGDAKSNNRRDKQGKSLLQSIGWMLGMTFAAAVCIAIVAAVVIGMYMVATNLPERDSQNQQQQQGNNNANNSSNGGVSSGGSANSGANGNAGSGGSSAGGTGSQGGGAGGSGAANSGANSGRDSSSGEGQAVDKSDGKTVDDLNWFEKKAFDALPADKREKLMETLKEEGMDALKDELRDQARNLFGAQDPALLDWDKSEQVADAATPPQQPPTATKPDTTEAQPQQPQTLAEILQQALQRGDEIRAQRQISKLTRATRIASPSSP